MLAGKKDPSVNSPEGKVGTRVPIGTGVHTNWCWGGGKPLFPTGDEGLRFFKRNLQHEFWTKFGCAIRFATCH